jgi:ketosteroid isomerase-like protein
MNPRSVWKSLGPVDQSIAISGDTAIVRHTMAGEGTREGKPNTANMGVMMVLQKQGGVWKMLARQGYKV